MAVVLPVPPSTEPLKPPAAVSFPTGARLAGGFLASTGASRTARDIVVQVEAHLQRSGGEVPFHRSKIGRRQLRIGVEDVVVAVTAR